MRILVASRLMQIIRFDCKVTHEWLRVLGDPDAPLVTTASKVLVEQFQICLRTRSIERTEN